MRKYWWLLLLPAALLLWWGLGQRGASVEAHFTKVKGTTIQSTVPTNGKVEPAEWAVARAETSGVVRSVNVQRGDSVRAGQTLVTLDNTAAQADLAAALAREQEARAQVTTLGQGGRAASVANLNDSIQSAREGVAIAQRIYDSDQHLFQQQAVTRLQVQTDADNLQRARLGLAALENQRRTAVTTTDKSVAEARLRDAEEAVKLAQHRVTLSEIRAPIAGTVYQFDLKLGAYLEPGTSVAQVGNLDDVKVLVNVDEPDLGRVALGMPVAITWEGSPDKKWWGKVDKLPTEVVALGTRMVGQVSTMIDNPDHDLLPGVSVNATIVSRTVSNGLAVPKAALRRLGTRDGVYKLVGNSIRWTAVTTGISDVNNVQVLAGVQSGDEVMDRIIDPSDAEIRNGMRVKPILD